MLWIIISIIISYLLGSIPTAFIFGKLIKGIDIRKFGSGNVGATNALRILGKKAGIAVLFFDILKGVIAVLLVQALVGRANVSADIFLILGGIACICGHNWTIFLNFKGGKGIATTLGVLIGLAVKTPGLGIILICLVLIWVLFFMFFRIVSLASIISSLFMPALMIIFHQSRIMIFSGFVLSIFVLLRHKPNIIRLLQGKEAKLYFNKIKQS